MTKFILQEKEAVPLPKTLLQCTEIMANLKHGHPVVTEYCEKNEQKIK